MADESARYAEYREEVLKIDNLRSRIRRGFPSWWGTLADTLGIASVITAAVLLQTVATTIIALIAIVALLAGLATHRHAQRTVGYAHAYSGLHIALHILRDVQALKDAPWNEGTIKSCLEQVLSAFAMTFTLVANAPCRACIKVIQADPMDDDNANSTEEQIMQRCYARTLCRDFATSQQVPKYESPKEAPVSGNTAFRFLFKSIRQRCYTGNNLPKLAQTGQYQNTSMHKYNPSPTDTSWSLPYKATMVWPIRFATEEDPQPESPGHTFTGKQDIIGYLAVDSPKKNAFFEQYDFDIGALLADALYVFLSTVEFKHPQNPVE